jgi:hypothetical protein
MNTLEQVATLKQQAVELLLAERDRIDAELAILGQEKATTQKRRGRPPKTSDLPSGPADTIHSTDSSTL